MSKTTTPEDFADDVLASEKLVLVHFLTEKISGCLDVRDALTALEENKSAQLEVVELDIDAHRDFAVGQDILGLPNVQAYRNGERVQTLVGTKTKEAIITELAELLS